MDERLRAAIEAQIAKAPATPESIQTLVALAVDRHFEKRSVMAWEWVKRVAAIAAIIASGVAIYVAAN